MDDLEARLHAEAAEIRARADAVAQTEIVLAGLRAGDSTHRSWLRWMPRAAALAGLVAAAAVGFVILRPEDGRRSISSSSGPDTTPAAPSATTSPTSSESAPGSTVSSETPFTHCDYTDPGKFPINVSRARTCEDGVAVEISGVVVADETGERFVCDASYDGRPAACIANGLRLVGITATADGTYRGVKHGDTLVVDERNPVTPLSPLIVGEPDATIPEDAIRGVVMIDGACVYLVDSADARARLIVWPAGSMWDARRREVILPDGQNIAEGTEISGRGEFHSIANIPGVDSEATAAVSACLPPGPLPDDVEKVVILFPDTVTPPTVVPLTPTS